VSGVAIAVVVVVAAVAVLLVVLVRLRRRRSESGVTSFQRHIDALSPENRREVAERVKRQRDEADAAEGHAGPDESDRP
jgi:hypothetical protein